MDIYRDNLLAIVISNNSLPIIVIAQNSFDLSTSTDIAYAIYLLSPIYYPDKRFFVYKTVHSVQS